MSTSTAHCGSACPGLSDPAYALDLLYPEGPVALRDFFYSQNMEEMRAAGLRLAVLFHFLPAAVPVVQLADAQWPEVEYDFNRFFVGPGSVVAPPYASVYLEPEVRLMGASTMHFRKFLQEMHTAVPGDGSLPDDFLPFELDAWVMACDKYSTAEASAVKTLDEACRWLLHDHMGAWIPPFIHRALQGGDMHPALALALAALQFWLEETMALTR